MPMFENPFHILARIQHIVSGITHKRLIYSLSEFINVGVDGRGVSQLSSQVTPSDKFHHDGRWMQTYPDDLNDVGVSQGTHQQHLLLKLSKCCEGVLWRDGRAGTRDGNCLNSNLRGRG